MSDSQSKAGILGYEADSISYSRGEQDVQRITQPAWYPLYIPASPPQNVSALFALDLFQLNFGQYLSY